MDFPGGTVDENPPANAGHDSRSGKIPGAMEQLSLCSTIREATARSMHTKAKSSPLGTTREEAHVQQLKPSAANILTAFKKSNVL